MELKEKIIIELTKQPQTFKSLKQNLSLKSFDGSKTLDKNLKTLWREKAIFFRSKTETYHLKQDEEVIGTFRATKNDYAFVETEVNSVFIPERFVLNALDKDTVKVILFHVREGEDPDRRAGKVVRVIQRNGSAIIGRVFHRRKWKKI